MTMEQCPKCGSMDLVKGTVGYGGCITDEIRGKGDTSWYHDAYQCKRCKTKFTIWENYDEFEPDLKK